MGEPALPHGSTVDAVREAATPLAADESHAALLELIGAAHYVLLGEATHGTHEFYRERARITQRLIADKGFDGVAVEGDWPDAWRVNRFVRGRGDDTSAAGALADFRRFPHWMWRNQDVVQFIDWQRDFNARRPEAQRTGFYGLDLYSLRSSMQAVLRHLGQADPAAARRAVERYSCFDHFGDDNRAYGLMAGLGGAEKGCEDEVVAVLADMRRRAAAATSLSGADAEEAFAAEQNARLVKNAEAYYRSMYLSDVSSWNLRDMHMAETLRMIAGHLAARTGRRPRLVVWEHNSHIGDARATEMGQRRGELNVGQLVRERHGDDAMLVGFSTHHGSVTAATDWDGPAERKQVRPSRPDSYEAVMHATGIERFLLSLRGAGRHVDALREARLERAIGVLYRPDTERYSHYFTAQLPRQFDALLHFNTTRAVEPLERGPAWREPEVPETYPSGL